jgi:hypothetical protein
VKDDEVRVNCSSYGRDEKWVQDLSVDGSIRIK